MSGQLTAQTEVHAPADVAPVAALFADPSRARIVAALSDGRALAASVLADESGVSPSTASEHLSRLVAGGLLTVQRSGRHRYYRLANDAVASALEALSVLAPQPPVRSLREATRAAGMRRARTCYDHLAGKLGVAVTGGLLEQGALVRSDGIASTDRRADDPLASSMPVHPYLLGPRAADLFGALGVEPDALVQQSGRRPTLRFCVDWSEQRHHLAGALGAAVLAAAEHREWIRRTPGRRAVEVTDTGRNGFAAALGHAVLDAYDGTAAA